MIPQSIRSLCAEAGGALEVLSHYGHKVGIVDPSGCSTCDLRARLSAVAKGAAISEDSVRVASIRGLYREARSYAESYARRAATAERDLGLMEADRDNYRANVVRCETEIAALKLAVQGPNAGPESADYE